MKNYILARDTPKIKKGACVFINNKAIFVAENNYINHNNIQALSIPDRDINAEIQRLLDEGWIEEEISNNPIEVWVNIYKFNNARGTDLGYPWFTREEAMNNKSSQADYIRTIKLIETHDIIIN